jgi:hypothetical protein
MAGIFISYRRSDTAGWAGRLSDLLSKHFGVDVVFMDTESIKAGINFRTAIEASISSCEVLLVLIGPHWLSERNNEGLRRLDDQNDYIRFEIETALKSNVRTIPVLLGEDTRMPGEQDLPPELRPLAMLNAYPVTDRRWSHDTDQLVAQLREILDCNVRNALRRKKYYWKAIGSVSLTGLTVAGFATEPLDTEFGLAASAVSLIAFALGVSFYIDSLKYSVNARRIALVQIAIAMLLFLSSAGYYLRGNAPTPIGIKDSAAPSNAGSESHLEGFGAGVTSK